MSSGVNTAVNKIFVSIVTVLILLVSPSSSQWDQAYPLLVSGILSVYESSGSHCVYGVVCGVPLIVNVVPVIGEEVTCKRMACCGGTNSYAPISTTAMPSPSPSIGLAVPSKSMLRASSSVPASMHGDPACR